MTQLGHILSLLVDARDHSEWLSLAELHALTGDAECSISAQLRNLRKADRVSTSWQVNKRRRYQEGRFTEWEYQLGQQVTQSRAAAAAASSADSAESA